MKRMGIIGVALMAALALSAFAASFANAEKAETVPSAWYVNGVKLKDGSSDARAILCHAAKHKFGATEETKLVLTSEVSGIFTELSATGIECLGEKSTEANAVIENFEATEPTAHTVARARGRLRFTGVKVTQPLNCGIEGENANGEATITTNELEARVEMSKASPERVPVSFRPTPGQEEVFAVIPITKCAIAGKAKVKGVAYGEAVKEVAGTTSQPTGVEEKVQPLTFSEEIQNTFCPTTKSEPPVPCLKLGNKAAYLTGRVANELKSGEKFGAKEK